MRFERIADFRSLQSEAYGRLRVPDVNMWIGTWEDQSYMADPRDSEMDPEWLAYQLKLIISNRMDTRRDPITSLKVDILDIRPLVYSDSKKVIIHVHARPILARLWNLPWRLRAIATDVKLLLGLPNDKQCVSVNFKPVLKRFWAKA
jgi:hypothetical protein